MMWNPFKKKTKKETSLDTDLETKQDQARKLKALIDEYYQERHQQVPDEAYEFASAMFVSRSQSPGFQVEKLWTDELKDCFDSMSVEQWKYMSVLMDKAAEEVIKSYTNK